MPIDANGRRYYRTAEVYRAIGISRNTLFNWLERGVLGEIELRDRRGWRLFTQDDLEILKREATRTYTVKRTGDNDV